MRRTTTTLASTAALLLVSLAAASPALAEAPWWKLTSGARPTYLHAGAAAPGVNEVQEIVTTSSQFEGYAEQSDFLLIICPETKFPCSAEEQLRIGEFVTEPLAKIYEEYGVIPLTAANIQAALEKPSVYGPGGATVAEASTDKEGKPLVKGDKRFVITSAGSNADRPVAPVEVGSVEAGTVEPSVVATGQPVTPDGEIYVTAENLGDQTVSGGSLPVTISDVLPPGLKAVAIDGTKPDAAHNSILKRPLSCSLEKLSCTLGKAQAPLEALAPYDQIAMRIAVDVEGSAFTGEENEVRISGGEGFVCDAVSPGTGSYRDGGCIEENGASGFERSATAPVASASLRRKLVVSPEATPFGVEEFELENEEEGGAPATQAGSHPFQLTTSITLNQAADSTPPGSGVGQPHVEPIALAKDLHFQWPAGLIGNPSPIPQCSDLQFFALIEGGAADACPPQTAVGVATVTINEPAHVEVGEIAVPLFNLVPRRGEPARFGFIVPEGNSPVTIDTSVRSGGDYGITVSVNNITQIASFLSSKVTVWGVPGDPRHNHQRGWSCLLESRGFVPRAASAGGIGACQATNEAHPPSFLSLPTSCTGPLKSTAEGDSWATPGALPQLAEDTMPALDGCSQLPFTPSIKVTPDGTAASTPTGLNVDVHVPQEESLNPEGLAISDPRDITVALPEGVAINPAGGDGLLACTEGLAGFTGFHEFVPPSKTVTFTEALPSPLEPGVNFCSNQSKIGTVKIKTPLLPNPIEGAVYLATQNQNPFGSLLALYAIAEDPVSGVQIKLAGETQLTEAGQIVTTFRDSPQAPFEDAEFHFFGGERAPLTTPARCGAYTTTATLTPWSGNPPITASSTFNITSGPNGSPCPGQALPFSPTLTGGTTNINAGSFSPLTTTIGREDGQQNLQSVQLHMPAGLSGLLSGVKLCDEADANAGTCGPESLIGETTVSAGVGGDPVSVKGGKVYITEKYAGSPFGLSIVNPVKAGPFDLEHDTSNANNDPPCDCIVVRAKVDVDPSTAALTITTDPSGAHAIPHLIDGIPVQIKKVNVLINREHFTFNPTSCNPQSITGSIASDEGASSPVSVPFQATNCATLKFDPIISFSTSGKTSKKNGADLITKLTYPSAPHGTYANVGYVKVELPKALPSRLTTLQKACLAKVFEANPASCPPKATIGYATVHTPLLPVPLTGPAIFVSHGGEAFPSLTMVLQGYGVTVDLVGATFISKAGITSTTFKTVPDTPFSTFELVLPQGPYSALAATGNLCKQKLVIPTEFISHAGGAPLKQDPTVAVTGCAPAITVVSHRVTGKTATIQVKVPSAGKLVASGKGLSKASKKARGASTVIVKLTLTNSEVSALAKHKGRKLKAKISLTFTPSKGKKLKASTAVILG